MLDPRDLGCLADSQGRYSTIMSTTAGSTEREALTRARQQRARAIARAAREHGCASVAFTYNDPVLWAE